MNIIEKYCVLLEIKRESTRAFLSRGKLAMVKRESGVVILGAKRQKSPGATSPSPLKNKINFRFYLLFKEKSKELDRN